MGTGRRSSRSAPRQSDATGALRELLDRAIRGKAIASEFFNSLATSVEEVHLRSCFRRLAQEEWDHRKILLKHRCELFGKEETGRDAEPDAAYAPMVRRPTIRGREDLRSALRTAIRTEREVHHFFSEASRNFEDRSVKVFLRILAEEGLAQVEHLRAALTMVDDGAEAPANWEESGMFVADN